MSDIEAIAAGLGLLNILLIVRLSIWNYPFALAMVSLYAVIFWEAKLYSDAGLQVFFFVINLYGWWAWNRNRAKAGTIVVERLSGRALAGWVLLSLASLAGWGWLMASHTDATHPYWDASVAMLSVAAQILMTRRYLENWWWWIAVNAISIPLYIVKQLHLTAGLYGLFLILALWGLIEWRRVEHDKDSLPSRA